MKQKLLFALWGGMFILCALLGFIPEPAGVVRGGLTLCALCFFLPPFGLLLISRKKGDKNTILLLRNLSAASLGLTLVVLTANFAAFAGSESLGNMLHILLVILSTPMVCGGNWLVSLFLWACLLVASGKILKDRK